MMEAFEKYTSELEGLSVGVINSGLDRLSLPRVVQALNGEPANILRRTVGREELRKGGIFFTSHSLANQAINNADKYLVNGMRILDLACGAGDLLIACARHLPLQSNIERTLSVWGQKLSGFDIHPEFVLATRARLALTAILRGRERYTGYPITSLSDLFPFIRVGDGLEQLTTINDSDLIVINPPYSSAKIPDNCFWAAGNISLAALFLDACVQNASAGARIIAILPDVLRSGSRYKKWRSHILSQAKIESLKLIGRFDKWADVDVFVLRLLVKPRRIGKDKGCGFLTTETQHATFGDFFHVHVGPVVPYRDESTGPGYPYI